MALVKAVAGPATAQVGETVSYQVTAFSSARPSAADRGAVSWLVKSEGGAALASVAHAGPVLTVTVPPAWQDQQVLVMPYLRSPSAAVAVRTHVPAVAEARVPRAAGAGVTVRVERDGRRFYASVDGEPRFYLGLDVPYGERRGLMNSGNPPGARYAAEEFEAAQGAWAWYLLPTITCESNRAFSCLNTYDRAAVTFGHGQFAAHTPNDNFVMLLREALGLPSAAAYFPDLAVRGGRIHRLSDAGPEPLESATSTRPLMQYFNASPGVVDAVEAERSARLVHWAVSHAELRELQVDFFVRQQKAKLALHARKLPLDGLTDKLCLAVLDILHQGRARYDLIRTALQKADPFDALLALGASNYRERIATLRQEIQKLEVQGLVGRKVYSRAAGDFVVPSGA
jgi:uncharacterized small protein (DUF1192 family)